jgi:hypothetical protein
MTLSGRWLDFALRLRSMRPRHPHGSYLLRLVVLIGPDDEPVVWSRPEITLLEPSRTSLEALLGVFCASGDGLPAETLPSQEA